jgi:hypothetical protein
MTCPNCQHERARANFYKLLALAILLVAGLLMLWK